VIDGDYNVDPLVILIDEETASAAEIVAGAIQDNDRGLVIGTSSYGKGLVQQILQFSDNSALKLTTAKYYTPSDRCIHKDTLQSDLIYPEKETKNSMHFTKSGRAVFGGGGIIPDIYVDKEINTPLVDELNMLGFATDFIANKSSEIEIDEDFSIDDKMVDEFLNFIKEQDYSYQNPESYVFSSFLEENEYFENSELLNGHTEAINKQLQNNSEVELQSQRMYIKEYLYERFIRAGLGQRQVCELIWFKSRAEFIEARRLLGSPDLYVGYLAAN